jgi:hypothetical protein
MVQSLEAVLPTFTAVKVANNVTIHDNDTEQFSTKNITYRYRSSERQKLIIILARSLADNTLGSLLLLSSLMLFTFSERCPTPQQSQYP